MKSFAPLLLCFFAPLLSCDKDLSGPVFKASNEIPTILDTQRDYRTEDLLDLADYFRHETTNRLNQSLEPADFKYAIETLVNRELKAGSKTGSDLQSHPLLFDYTLNDSGKIDGGQFDSIYAQIVAHVDYLETMGSPFHIIDVEIVQGDRILADIITVVGYVNTDLAFGFSLLPSGQSYQVLQNSFKDIINDRIFVEALDEDEYFYTDIYPNPSVYPLGLTLGAVDIIGPLGIGDCLMYAGTREIFGGPELVYGNNNQSISMSGQLANEYIMKGINNIESRIPPFDGLQLIRLQFGIGNSPSAINGNCLPGDPCNDFYPCFVYKHSWSRGFAARKTAIEK